MGIFNKRDKKTLELTAQAQEERAKDITACQKEISEVLIKYGCDLKIRQEIVINHK